MRPEVGQAALGSLQASRPEIAVRLLVGENAVNPLADRGDDFLILEHVAEIACAAQPVGHLLPAVVGLGIDPAVALVLQIRRNLRQSADQPGCVELELMPKPTLGCDGAGRQLEQGESAPEARGYRDTARDREALTCLRSANRRLRAKTSRLGPGAAVHATRPERMMVPRDVLLLFMRDPIATNRSAQPPAALRSVPRRGC